MRLHCTAQVLQATWDEREARGKNSTKNGSFVEYFTRNKAELICDHYLGCLINIVTFFLFVILIEIRLNLAPVREKYGFGSPPSRVTNNISENMNQQLQRDIVSKQCWSDLIKCH